ncbi:hypothetical protein BDA99DRAFT_525917 [Phascolomyces articulosus]|uniref:F-box domain-containing protein n=1 Tax=Phascolomyces articulosus TaxID=60185 RepID=A0AAD5P8H2_9FUNG|nr:hypothetical protein BDA99DRAFT_525917 [Phascolomyces articulosus]
MSKYSRNSTFLNQSQASGSSRYSPSAAQLTNHIDFITQVPYETLCNILYYLDIHSVLMCTYVCHTWRSRITECHQPWQTLSVKLEPDNHHHAQHLLSIVSQYTKNLTLSFVSVEMSRTVMLLQKHFTNLRSLTLFITCYRVRDAFNDLLFYDGISSIGPKLLELDIEWDNIFSALELNRILSICQNLTKLRCLPHKITDWSISHTTQLVSIHLEPRSPITFDNGIERLLQHSPNLRHLELQCHDNLLILHILDRCYQHRPPLVTLILNKRQFQQQFGPVRIPSTRPCTVLNEGQPQCLIFRIAHSADSLLSLLFESGRDTLQTLCLNIGQMRGDLQTMETSLLWQHPLVSTPTMLFPKLTYLHIMSPSDTRHTRPFYLDHVSPMLRCCPALETLVLERYSTASEDQMIEDAIYPVVQQKLKKLSRLRLIGFYVNGPHFKQLLRHFARDSATTTDIVPLRQLSIFNNDCRQPVKSNILWYIVRITTLEELQLRCPYMKVTDADMTDFTYFIRRLMMWLIHLELDNMRVHEYAVENLAHCHSLWTLTIQGIGSEMTQNDIQVLEAHGKVVITRRNIRYY